MIWHVVHIVDIHRTRQISAIFLFEAFRLMVYGGRVVSRGDSEITGSIVLTNGVGQWHYLFSYQLQLSVTEMRGCSSQGERDFLP